MCSIRSYVPCCPLVTGRFVASVGKPRPHWRAVDWNFRGISSGHVAVGFMPAFNHNQRILLAVFERGHKARGYVHSGTFWRTWTAVVIDRRHKNGRSCTTMVERKSRAVSSIGRAFGLHPKGRRFEPCTAHSFCPPRSENRRRNRDQRKRHLCRIADPPSALVFSDPLRVDEKEQREAGCDRVYGKDHAGKVVHAICGARRKPKQNLFNSGTVKALPSIGAPTEEPGMPPVARDFPSGGCDVSPSFQSSRTTV